MGLPIMSRRRAGVDGDAQTTGYHSKLSGWKKNLKEETEYENRQ